MRPITGDCACGRWFVQSKTGALRVYCSDCKVEREKQKKARQYIRNRKNNPQWTALNKKRAKAWRAANKDHIRAYLEARP